MEVELDDGGKHNKKTWEIKNTIKSNLVELKKGAEEVTEMFWKKDALINSFSESCQGKFSVKILEKSL